jgi:hypothetical protein
VPDNTPPQIIQAQGFITFSYTLVPLTPQVNSTPPIPFSFFDPKTRKYTDLTIPAVPLTVRPGATAGDLQTLLQTNSVVPDNEEQLSLSGLAPSPGHGTQSLVPWQEQSWFPLVQLIPAAAFVGLWGWDQRRRYHEANPQIMRRRRARRALRREWRMAREAARSNNEPGFINAAVSALRFACAPHYPAEPGALVGADVIQVLGNKPDSNEVELVRCFFNRADGSRFGEDAAQSPSGSGSGAGLLARQTDLDRLLQRLEGRLS